MTNPLGLTPAPTQTIPHPLANISTMQNDRGVNVELFEPRKCSATNRLIKAKDHASVQINVAKLNDQGRIIQGDNISYAISGFVRAKGESDDSINRLAQADGLLQNVFSYTR